MSKARELSVVPQQSIGFKNRIINGAMNVNQRGGYSAANTAGTAAYSLDRWFSGVGSGTTTLSLQQVSTGGLAGFTNCLQYQRASGQTNTAQLYLTQQIESVNMQDLQGQTISISFWAKAGANFSSASNALAVYTVFGTGTDQAAWGGVAGSWTGWTIQVPTTATLTTSWQKFTATATVPSNANEMQLTFGYTPVGTAGASDFYQITGVQLEKGSNATSFDYRPYTTELQLCQRYAWKCSADGNVNQIGWAKISSTSTRQYGFFQYPVTMRTTPSSISYSNLSVGTYYGAAGVNITSVTIDANTIGSNNASLIMDTGSSLGSAGTMLLITSQGGGTGYVLFNAEL